MIPRALGPKLREAAAHYPVVTLTGPRQSGKTTLVRAEFPQARYVSLELPDVRSFALTDPRGFLSQFDGPVILDEVQRAPDLFSYIQFIVDERKASGQFILTGSQNFLLLQGVSQTLAGRCAVLHLLPLALSELARRPPLPLEFLGRTVPGPAAPGPALERALFDGGYPRIHDQGLEPRDWLASYYRTYLERDVRDVLNVGDLETFGRFVRLCAGRNAQLLSLSGLAADCGVSHTTARRWLSLLEACFVITLLRPHHRNFGKRVIKSPKVYFLDTGLLCFLLQIRTPEELVAHSSRGAIFESFVLSELQKSFINRGEIPELSFWRDSAGHEVDFIVEWGQAAIPIEAKSGKTVASDFFLGLDFWRALARDPAGPAALVYGGDESFRRSGTAVYSWRSL